MPDGKPHYHGHRKRLRERMAKNPGALADYELLELLLAQYLPRQDTKPLAKELLDRFTSLHGVIHATDEQLLEVAGFGPACLKGFVLLRELKARMAEERFSARRALSGPAEIADAARARFGTKPVEELWALYLDTRNRVLSWQRIASGSVGSLGSAPRDILAPALAHQAARVVLVHNHPGGSAWPSEQDKSFTLAVARAAKGLDLHLADHLIVTELDYYSFHEDGLL